MKNLSLELTADGSHSIFSEDFQALYHSKYGAIQESAHVFIKSGLDLLKNKKGNLNILEMGLGTGLNMLLTYIVSESNPQLSIHYDSVEAYPIVPKQALDLNYLDLLKRNDLEHFFSTLHHSDWNSYQNASSNFRYRKLKSKIEEVNFDHKYDLVYYDAFSPDIQEELWKPEIFHRIAKSLNNQGVLVSYCCKGTFKRALISAGFTIEKIPGPPGKREMIRATFHI